MTSPLVTIGIPTYNRGHGYMREALESALAQTYPNLEIIVADNCSSDGTGEVVASYADPRIRYFRHEPGIKPNDNLNFCLHQAQGAYVLLLHDDDKIDPDFVAACMRGLDSEAETGIIRTGVRTIDPKGNLTGEVPNRAGGLSTADYFLAWFEGKTSFYMCNTLHNTRRLKEIGGLRSKHNLFQDDVAAFTLAARYGRVDVPDVKSNYRVHSGALTKVERIADWCEDSLELLAVMCELAPEKKDEIRKRGMRYLARVNYARASSIRAFGRRLSAYLLVFRMFGCRYPPPVRMVLGSTALYRALRRVKRRFLGLPAWAE